MNLFDSLLVESQATLRGVAGDSFAANTGEQLVGLIQIESVITEPGPNTVQAKTPVYASVFADPDCVANPHAITTLTNGSTGKVYRVIEYRQTADPTEWTWFCEVER